MNLLLDANPHPDLILFLGSRQDREGVEISMGPAPMKALRGSPLFKESEEENPRKSGGER